MRQNYILRNILFMGIFLIVPYISHSQVEYYVTETTLVGTSYDPVTRSGQLDEILEQAKIEATAGDIFGQSTQKGTTGWYCAYNGNGNAATITGQTRENDYTIMVRTHHGTPGNEQYDEQTSTGNPNTVSIYPDFIAENAVIHAGVIMHSEVSIDNTNQGPSSSHNTTNVHCYLSADNVFDASNNVIGSKAVNTIPGYTYSLEPNTETLTFGKVRVPAGTAAGQCYLFFYGDKNDV